MSALKLILSQSNIRVYNTSICLGWMAWFTLSFTNQMMNLQSPLAVLQIYTNVSACMQMSKCTQTTGMRAADLNYWMQIKLYTQCLSKIQFTLKLIYSGWLLKVKIKWYLHLVQHSTPKSKFYSQISRAIVWFWLSILRHQVEIHVTPVNQKLGS